MNFDVLIIGSGAGGGTTAYALTRRGLKVCLVERGQRFRPQLDYVQNYPDWETRHNPLEEARRNETTIDLSYRTPITQVKGKKNIAHFRPALHYHRVFGLGGSTLHYQGEAHRFAAHSFKPKSLFNWGTDWPLQYADLKPYYQQIEQLLGVAGEIGNPFKPQREAFPTPAHLLSEKSRILAVSAKKVGMTLQPNTLALPTKSIDGRLPCQHSGGCNYGCIFGAKSSVDQSLIPLAEKTGNLTIMTNTRVIKLASNNMGGIIGVDCVRDNNPLRLTAKRYVLATGAIETPRLLLHSQNNQHSLGIGNHHDQVGRYFMETVMASQEIKLTADINTFRGPPIDARIWDFCYPMDAQTNGFVLGLSGYLSRHNGPSNQAIRTTGLGRAHKQKVKQQFGRQIHLFGIAEQQPDATNRILLSDELDSDGVAKVKVHSAYSMQDRHTLDVMKSKLNAWAQATDTSYIGIAATTYWRSSATHVAGTCRMGNNPTTSVVNQYGKVHSVSNLYITDASVLPTQGSGDSPSLTIQALALRTADKIATDLLM